MDSSTPTTPVGKGCVPATVAGATDRNTLIALLRRNANLIKELRVQLKPYQSSPTKHEVWLRFQGYTKLIVLGRGGPKGGPPPLSNV